MRCKISTARWLNLCSSVSARLVNPCAGIELLQLPGSHLRVWEPGMETLLMVGLRVNRALQQQQPASVGGAFPIACSEQRRSAVAWHRIMFYQLPLRVPPPPAAASTTSAGMRTRISENQYWYWRQYCSDVAAS